MKVVTFTGIYWLSVKEIDEKSVRPVASEDEIDQALAFAQEPPVKLSVEPGALEREIDRAREEVSLASKIKIIRDLHAKNALEDISTTEELFLIRFKKEFENELSIVKGDKAKDVLEKALEVSVSKASVA